MNICISTKSSLLGPLFALVLSLLAGSYGENSLAQTTQGPTAAASANMTKADFNPVTNNLITARIGILNNDSATAYNAINTASSELFGLTQNAAGSNVTLVQQLDKEFRQLQNYIDDARDALRENNSTQTLRALNVADVRFHLVTQGLPPGEEENAETETEE